MNSAVAYHAKNAVAGLSPNFGLDLTKLMFSQGKLDSPANATAILVQQHSILLNWTNPLADHRYKDDTDVLTVLVYNSTKNRFFYQKTTVERTVMAYHLALPASYRGDVIQVYLSFNSLKTKRLRSNSVYIGALTVPKATP